jgi:serine/threonine protein kinase
MALSAGTSLGVYEIVAQLGAGGMGEVYRARDPKLGRDVAIKVLPDLFVDDPERVARFQREAQALAALNHPNIAAIYGLEESGGTRFLAMELVEGESLAEHVEGQRAKGTGLTIAESIAIARQIGEALQEFHPACRSAGRELRRRRSALRAQHGHDAGRQAARRRRPSGSDPVIRDRRSANSSRRALVRGIEVEGEIGLVRRHSMTSFP